MYKINKYISDDIELLPDVADTSLWKKAELFEKYSKAEKIAMILYSAISKRENYYQLNTPTAYGEPQYSYYCGLVSGILQANGFDEWEENGLIIIKKKNRKFLVIDKLKRPQTFYDAKKETAELLDLLGV